MRIQLGPFGVDWGVAGYKSGRIAAVTSRYEEAVLRGNVYAVANQSGVTSQVGLSATTPVLTLANPVGSGVNCVLWYADAVFLVVFGAAAAVWLAHGRFSNTAVTGTDIVPTNMLTGIGMRGKVLPLTAATLPAAPIGAKLLGAGLTGAITTAPTVPVMGGWLDGSFIIPPGCNVSVQTSTASGTSAQLNSFIYEERPQGE